MSEAVRGSEILKKPIDLVFIVTANVIDKPFSEIKKEVEKISDKLENVS